MPWLDIAAAALILLTLITGMVTRRTKAAIVITAGMATAAVLVVAVSVEGPRPQVLALLTLAVLTAGVVVWLRSSRRPRLAAATSLILILSLVGVAGAAWVLPPISIPAGSGSFTVGMNTKVWTDHHRDARGGTQPGERRSLPATIWYPAEASGERAAYLPGPERAKELSSALANLYGIPAFTLDSLSRARSNAMWQGQPALGSFPVVVASPGLNSTRWFFTTWAEELASNGVIVIALDHPYDAPVTELANGTWVHSELETTGDDARDQDLADQWTSIRASDMSALITQVLAGTSDVPGLRFADTTRFITAGHSLGGAAALEAARLDARVKAAVDIDGMPRTPEGAVTPPKPVLALVGGDADPLPDYDAALDALLANGKGTRVTLEGVTHFGMIDVGLMVAPIPGITGTRGSAGPTSVAQATLRFIASVATDSPVDISSLTQL
ncbi:alpha/beta fold hydrolase [Arthrobacter sp. ISL-95]|uniref:alpha/beta hydrolase family protein n=1 Tax=Arthrobacter sp. ISL-95 TaxID=2819116 RepID=UPI001BE9196A|nr:alpha/beta fold hydrolase [Arthrobacter sp. ISL-95]MBT2588555.1 alpha/beta fold hydrolase [Arthrobacter sp. ISL-95]